MIRTGEAKLDDWEQTLQELQPDAWEDFLKKSANEDFTFHKIYGLRHLSEFINEAKGYVFLKERGCDQISFIPTGRKKTPDIEGYCDTGKIILEVKTVNLSTEYVWDRFWNSYDSHGKEMKVCDVPDTLPDGLKEKLAQLCEDTVQKFKAYDNLDASKRHILFCVVNLDAGPCLSDEMWEQLDRYLRSQLENGIELEIATWVG